MMITDEFIPGQSAMRILGGAYEYAAFAEIRIMLPVGGLRPRDEILYRLTADVCRRCAAYDARCDVSSASGLRLLCRTALDNEKYGAIITVGMDDDGTADVKTLFSGRMPSKSRLLAAAGDLFRGSGYTRWALAHNYADTDGLSDAVYANELYQLAAEAGVSFEDYLVFRGTDCYSIREQYREFWR